MTNFVLRAWYSVKPLIGHRNRMHVKVVLIEQGQNARLRKRSFNLPKDYYCKPYPSIPYPDSPQYTVENPVRLPY